QFYAADEHSAPRVISNHAAEGSIARLVGRTDACGLHANASAVALSHQEDVPRIDERLISQVSRCIECVGSSINEGLLQTFVAPALHIAGIAPRSPAVHVEDDIAEVDQGHGVAVQGVLHRRLPAAATVHQYHCW